MSEKQVTILPQEYTDEDMAAIGRAFMDAIEQARQSDPWVKDWAPAQCPSEIIFDLLNRAHEELSDFENESHRDYHALEVRLGAAEAVIGWVESWVCHPVGSYSVYALDGLFGMTRDKIAALTDDAT